MAIKFDFTADNRNFVQVAKQTELAVNDITSATKNASGAFKEMIQQAAGLAGISFGVAGIKEFTSKVFEVRSYFQDINSSMVAFLGNQEKADKFTQELKDYAWYNMFEFSELAQASQQMIAYGSAAEDIIPTIDRLSDIAVATKANLLDLVAMYNKAKSTGSVDSHATQTWATHGLVIKNALKEMGEEADKTSFTFDELQKVIEHSTSEGGLFYQQQAKMMDNLSSSLGQLQDDMDSAFNEIGEMMQQPMKDAIEFASGLVDNYKEIAASILEVVAAYGAYRAALAFTKSADKTANTIMYEKEVAAMREAIGVKEEVKNADLAEMVSKGQLSQASAERVAALREEIAAEHEKYAAEMQSKAARGAISKEQADELIALNETLLKKRDIANIEEEIAQTEYDSAQAQLNNINSRIKANEDERASLRESINSWLELGNAEKAEAEKTEMATLVNEASTLSTQKEAAAKRLETAQENLNTASKEANAAATAKQTAMQSASIKSMGLMTAASKQLNAILKSINATIDANPLGLIVAGVTALGYAVYKLATYETEAEKAARELNEAYDELTASTETEQKEIDRLFGALKGATNGTKEYNEAKKEIVSKYGQYLQGLNEEIAKLNDVEAAYRAVSAAARQAAIDRAMDDLVQSATDKYKDSVVNFTGELRNALEKVYGEEKGNSILSQLQAELRQTGEISEKTIENLKKDFKGDFWYANMIEGINGLNKAEQDLAKSVKETNDLLGMNTHEFESWTDGMIDGTISALNRLKAKMQETGLKKGKLQLWDGREKEFINTEGIDDYLRKLEEVKASHHKVEQSSPKLSESYAKAKKEVDELTAKIKDMDAHRENYTEEQYKEAKQQLADAEKRLKDLGYNKNASKELNRDRKNAAELIEIERQRGLEQIKIRKEAALELRKLNNSINKDKVAQAKENINIEYDEAMETLRQKEVEMQEEKIKLAKDIWSRQKGRKDTDVFDTSSVDLSLTTEQSEYLTQLSEFYKKRKKIQEDELADNEAAANNQYLLEYGNYEEKKLAIMQKYAKIREDAATEGEKNIAYRQEREELRELDSVFSAYGNSIEQIFDNIEEKSRKSINEAIEAYQMLIDAISNDKTLDESELMNLTKLGFSPDFLRDIQEGKVELKDLIDSLKDLKKQDQTLMGASKRLGEAIKQIFGKATDGETPEDKSKRVNLGLQNLGKTLTEVGSLASSAAGMMQEFFSNIGKKDAAEAIGNVKNVLDTTMSMAATGAAIAGPWGAAAGAAMGLASSLVQVFSSANDEKLSERIDAIDERIHKLTRSYEVLEDAVNKTYSKDKANAINLEIANLEQQNKLINEQIRLENQKKDTDSNAIQSYRDTIEDNRRRIKELEESAKDAIFGSSIQSAIEDFANAYADAWANNTNRTANAKEQIRKMMQDMVKESIKAAIDSSSAMQEIRKKMMEFYADGVFSDVEQDALYRAAEDLQKELDARFGWSKDLLNKDKDFTQQGTSGGFTAMSQDSADELNGRFAASQMVINQQLQTLLAMHDVGQSIYSLQKDIYEALSEIRNISMAIDGNGQDMMAHTKHLVSLNERFESMNRKLDRL